MCLAHERGPIPHYEGYVTNESKVPPQRGTKMRTLKSTKNLVLLRSEKKMILDLFAGIGNVSRGFLEGYCAEGEHIYSVLCDIAPEAIEVFEKNYDRSNHLYLPTDIGALQPIDIFKQVPQEEIVGILGCPPCQGFSSAGRRDVNDVRNRLVISYFRLINKILPSFFVMENVPGVFAFDLFQRLLNNTKQQYNVWSGVLNAALYGVPQTRQRAIVIGYRKDLGIFPSPPLPTHCGTGLVFDYYNRSLISPCSTQGLKIFGVQAPAKDNKEKWREKFYEEVVASASSLPNLITVEEAIGDLPENASGYGESLDYAKAPTRYSASLRGLKVEDHVAWHHGAELVQRLTPVLEGEGWLDIDGIGRAKKYYSQAYSRLHRLGLAKTVTTNFHNPGSGRYLHFAATRTLTVREAARLQGIHDGFSFGIRQTSAKRLVGNSFPVPLARAIGEHVKNEIR